MVYSKQGEQKKTIWPHTAWQNLRYLYFTVKSQLWWSRVWRWEPSPRHQIPYGKVKPIHWSQKITCVGFPGSAVPSVPGQKLCPQSRNGAGNKIYTSRRYLTSLDLKPLETPTRNHGIVWVGEDLKDHLIPTPAPRGQGCIIIPPIFIFPSHEF